MTASRFGSYYTLSVYLVYVHHFRHAQNYSVIANLINFQILVFCLMQWCECEETDYCQMEDCSLTTFRLSSDSDMLMQQILQLHCRMSLGWCEAHCGTMFMCIHMSMYVRSSMLWCAVRMYISNCLCMYCTVSGSTNVL